MDTIQVLIWLFLFLNVTAAVGVVLAGCVSRRGVEVNHLLLFTCGFLFYWILPVVIGSLRLFETVPGMSLWYGTFDQVPVEQLAIFLLLCLVYYTAFSLGSEVGERMFAKPPGWRRDLFFDRRLLHLYLIPSLAAAGVLAFALRAYLFRGYEGFVYEEVTLRGSLISVSLVLLVLALLYTMKLEREKEVSFRRVIANRFFFAYAIVAVLILSMGGRLYFLSSIFMLLVYRTMFFGPLKPRSLVLAGGWMALGSLVLGIVRLGGGFDTGSLLMNLGAEPLFTSFSLLDFLRTHELEWFRSPVFLVSGFANLLPTAVFPWKQDLILDPASAGFEIFSPFGALNAFVSFMINFGVVGTALVLFLFAAFLGALKATRGATPSKILYILISGWLAFSFFRDPFSVSLVKTIFQFSILVPGLVLVSLHVLSVIGRRGGYTHSTRMRLAEVYRET